MAGIYKEHKLMKKYFTALVLFGLVGVILVGVGIIHSRDLGVCFGSCDSDRRSEFEKRTTPWLAALAYCNRAVEQDAALRNLFPELALSIEAANSEFAALAEKEQKGTLTLGERNSYLENPFRVSASQPSILSYFDKPQSDLAFIQACHASGFSFYDSSSLKGYCSGYARVEPKGSQSWDQRLEAAYNRMRGTGEIEGYLAKIEGVLSRHWAAVDQAEAVIQSMPAAQFSTDNPNIMKFEIEMKKHKLVCVR